MADRKHTFIRVTNEMVYKEIQDTHKELFSELKQIKDHLATLNGSVRVNRWVSRTAISLCVILLGVLLKGVV